MRFTDIDINFAQILTSILMVPFGSKKVLYKLSIDTALLSVTLHVINREFIFQSENDQLLNGHNSDISQQKKSEFSSTEWHRLTPSCQSIGQNSKYPGSQKDNWGDLLSKI